MSGSKLGRAYSAPAVAKRATAGQTVTSAALMDWYKVRPR